MATQILTITDDDFIVTTVTTDAAVTASWISDLRYVHSAAHPPHNGVDPLVIGFAIGYGRASGHLQEPVDTLQLCDGNACLIFQIQQAASIPDLLREFLDDPDNMFVGVRICSDSDKLFADHGLRIGDRARTLDLRSFTARSEDKLQPWFWGLQRTVKNVIRNKYAPLRGLQSYCDNEVRWFEQVKYACLDAFYSFEMGTVVLAAARLPAPLRLTKVGCHEQL